MSSIDHPHQGAFAQPRRKLVISVSLVLLAMCVLGAVRNPAGLPIYLRALAPLAGLLYFVAVRRIDPLLAAPYLIGMLGLVSAFQHGFDPVLIAKYIQYFAMVMMAQFVATQDPRRVPQLIALLLAPVALVAIPLEVLVGQPDSERALFGISMPRFIGLAGLHTHSAYHYMFIALLLLYGKRFLLAGFFVAATLTTGSRGFAAAAAAALVVALMPGRLAKGTTTLVLVVVLCSAPLIIDYVNSILAAHEKIYLNLVTTRRFDHWVTYTNMGLNNPIFGVGYLRGIDLYAIYAENIAGWRYHEQDGHNLYISLWGEWGIVAWAIFCSWLLFLTGLVAVRAPRCLPVLAYVVMIYTFHDGISEWVLWFAVGWLIAQVRRAGAGPEPAADGRRG